MTMNISLPFIVDIPDETIEEIKADAKREAKNEMIVALCKAFSINPDGDNNITKEEVQQIIQEVANYDT